MINAICFIMIKLCLQNSRKEVNVMLKKEAEYFGDIVILPFIDRYELVVLKTIAICEYGVRHLCHYNAKFVLYFLHLYCLSMSTKANLQWLVICFYLCSIIVTVFTCYF